MVARRLVVCCDGTWNKPRSNTNIYRTYCELRAFINNPDETVGFFGSWRSCTGQAPDGAEMLLYYHRGVGTTLLDWATGGISGVGVSDNVCAVYQFMSG